MKVWILYLAFLILAIVFIPHFASEYIITDNTLDGDSDIRLYDVSSGKTLTISLEDYIVGVVCAEMPAEFFDEALKAQAVAARTYAVKKIKSIIAAERCKVNRNLNDFEKYKGEESLN